MTTSLLHGIVSPFSCASSEFPCQWSPSFVAPRSSLSWWDTLCASNTPWAGCGLLTGMLQIFLESRVWSALPRWWPKTIRYNQES
jgi:hypothetical protein